MSTPEKLSARVPFAGFYCTWHDEEFNHALSRMFDPEGEEPEFASALQQRFSETINWHEAHSKYAASYCAYFAGALGLTVCEFEEMRSPREYNFQTDRLFCLFSFAELLTLFQRFDVRTRLDVVAADLFTSRSGFMSYYSPDVASWGDDLGKWDHNQLSALLQAAADTLIADGAEFGQQQEFDLMESPRCNGRIDEWMWDSTNDDARMGNRCDRVARYLASRETR